MITGAASGIGRSLARRLSRLGSPVAIADIDEAGLKETARTLPGPVLARVLDVRDAADQRRFAAEVREWLASLPDRPPLAAVFNNAGVAVASSVLDADPDDDEWLRQINFDGVVNGTRAFLPILVEQDDGVIVNTSSVFGLAGMPYQSAYCASKFAVRGFTDSLRQELRGTGVRAVTVHPGGIRTNIARNARVRKDPEGRGRSQEQMAAEFEALLRTTPDKAAEIICRGRRPGQGPHPGRPRRLRLRRAGPGRAHPLLRRAGATGEAAQDGGMMTEPETIEHCDVLIVGAGLSGIGAAHHLQAAFPAKTYAILEARDTIGGTWDLFRYPGVRSDSDMFTLGYRFRPWTEAKAIADGPSILDYVQATAAEAGIEKHIRFGHRVRRASWSGEQARWTVEAELPGGETATLTCGFLLMCSGYYRYDQSYQAELPGHRELRRAGHSPAVLAR